MEHTFESLRTRYPVFSYRSYRWEKSGEDLLLSFDFYVDERIRFSPQSRICHHPAFDRFFEEEGLEKLDNLVFHIGMIELISYWKCCCCPEIRIECAALDQTAMDWWKNLYYNGLGEFFYINGIQTDREHFVHLSSTSSHRLEKQKFTLDDTYIVPIGGGKDSVVTLETLKSQQTAPLPMIINPRGATVESVKVSGLKEGFLEIRRPIDPLLLQLNAEGYLNGHTPFSAMLAFYSLLVAAMAGRRRIALSNESSANEPTVLGSSVNHQYSKSVEFESDFRHYVKTCVQDGLSYFSFLRPLSELQIAALFSRQPDYFPVFKSCNAGSKANVWCGHCPKCLFAFIILSPFLSEEILKGIFGRNLLEDESLTDTLKQLCGLTEVKPFECVGTRNEVCLSLCKSMERYRKLPVLLDFFSHTELYEEYRQADFNAALRQWNSPHFLDKKEEALLKARLGIS